MANAARRRAMVEKLREEIARLQKEIVDRRVNMMKARDRALAAKPKGSITSVPSWFAVWSRHAPPLARAVGQLDRARARLAKAEAKADTATMREREVTARVARIRAANEAMIARIDARAGDRITERWNRERREEAKREKARRKQIAKRTRKDITARPDWMQKPVKLPPPIEQPDLSSHQQETVTIPLRPGLLSSDIVPVNPVRIGRLIDRPKLPEIWTATYVGVRLIEAHRVLQKMPGGNSWGPRAFGAAWPAYRVEAGEAAIQAGAGTLFTGRRVKVAPSSEAVARMNEAIVWPMQFLGNRPGAAQDVNLWADEAAWDQMDFDARGAPWRELQVIADALNAAKEVVR